MKPLYLLVGSLLLIGTTVDLLWTTLWVQGGAGPFSSRLMSLTWRAIRRAVGDRQRLLTLSGPVVLVVSLLTWIALLWAGWTLLLAGGEQAIIDTRQDGPISWVERLYFVAYTMFTMGNGDFTPNDGVWQIATSLMTASGMLFVTLMVTYVLSVLGAVTQKRAFASGVSGLGDRSGEILRRSWDGETFRGLDLPLNSLASQVDTLTANHKAYPILHYFHGAQAKSAPVVGIVVLDEMLTTLRFGVAGDHRPPDVLVHDARASVEDYLELLHEAFIDPADDPPPEPPLSALVDAGIPTVTDEEFAAALDDASKRRRQLRGLVESDRREWPNLTDDGDGSGDDGEAAVVEATPTE